MSLFSCMDYRYIDLIEFWNLHISISENEFSSDEGIRLSGDQMKRSLSNSLVCSLQMRFMVWFLIWLNFPNTEPQWPANLAKIQCRCKGCRVYTNTFVANAKLYPLRLYYSFWTCTRYLDWAMKVPIKLKNKTLGAWLVVFTGVRNVFQILRLKMLR